MGLALLVAASALLRTRYFDLGFWIDEGLSVGIADRPLGDIPGVLRQDGSPPLYYLLLSLWMGAAGKSETATHALSLLFALACIPAAFLAARSLFGERAAWFAAVLFALNPFLTRYAQETRMYSLVVLLAIAACWSFARVFVASDGRPWLFGLALAALLYTHNWSLFLAAGFGLVWLVVVLRAAERPPLWRDGAIGFGTALAVYAPWLPTLAFQAAHTGAPWATRPGAEQLIGAPEALLGDTGQIALLLAGGAGAAALWRGGRRTAALLAAVAGVALVLAFASSQLEPAWAVRYLAVLVAPLLLAAGAGLAAAGRLGVAGLALCAVIWAADWGPDDKSNIRDVAEAVSPMLEPGDLWVSTQPEQIPVSAYYLPGGLRYATLWGPVGDLGVTDWRDGVERMERTSAPDDLLPLMDDLAVGQRLVLLQPVIYDLARWSAPWTTLVRERSEEWMAFLRADPRFRVIALHPPAPLPAHPNPVRATVFVKTAMR